MKLVGQATGFIEIHNQRLCLRDEKTDFRIYFSCDDLKILKSIAFVKERVLLTFEPLNMRHARVRPLQLERCPEERKRLSFSAYFLPEKLFQGDLPFESSFLTGGFAGDDKEIDVILDPLYESYFYSVFHDNDSRACCDVICARFFVRSDWHMDLMYTLEAVDQSFSFKQWQTAENTACFLPLCAQDSVEKHRPKRRPVSSRLRYEVLLRDGHRCVDCGASALEDPLVRLEIDHRIPVSKGGTNDKENLQTLCWACNNGKSDNIDHKLSSFNAELDPWSSAA